jgi:predicted transcriptional regulator
MYKAYLSYSQLKEYLSLLQDRQLLKYEEGSQIYTITEKGLRFMNAYDDIRELVSGTSEESFQKENLTEKADDKKAEMPTW